MSNAENQAVSVNHYFIRQAVIKPHMMTKGVNPSNNIEMDISPMITEVSISEGMGMTMLTGYLKIVDSAGLLGNYPFRGEERLTLVMEDAVKNVRVWDLFIHKIDNVKVTNDDKTLTYNMHFMTFQSFIALNSNIIKSYRGLHISDMALDLFKEHFWRERNDETFAEVNIPSNSRSTNEVFKATRRGCVVETTEGFNRLIIPRLPAPAAMNFLVQRAHSPRSPSNSFRFFETSTNYYFISDEELVRRAAQDPLHTFPMTFSPGLPRGGIEFGKEFNNLSHFENIRRIDTIEDLYGGAYKSHVIEADIFNQIANIRPDPNKDFDFYRDMPKYYKAPGGKSVVDADRHTKEFMEAYSRYDNAKQYLFYKDWSEGTDIDAFQVRGEQYILDIARTRFPFRMFLNSITVVAKGPSRLDIIPGDVIDVNIKEINAQTHEPEDNERLSGKYLVFSLTRHFSVGEGNNLYSLVKVNWTDTVDTGVLGADVETSLRNATRGVLDQAFEIINGEFKL